ncbi:MAG: hypothetical protein AAF633_22690, partial [Chloroflexota bacterium]
MLKKAVVGLGCGLILFLLIGATFPYLVEVEAQNQGVNRIDAKMEALIVDTTVYMTMFTLNESEGEAEYVSAVRNEGLGTVVSYADERLIVTHNHWAVLESGTPDIIRFFDAYGQPLLELSGNEFMSLVRYTDSGTMIFKAPNGLPVQAIS